MPASRAARSPAVRSRLTAAGCVSALALVVVGCGGDGEPSSTASTTGTAAPSQPLTPTASGSSGTSAPAEPSAPATPEVVEEVAGGLTTPWGLDFLPDGRAVVTERDTGLVLIVAPDGEITEAGEIAEAAPVFEAGLLGVAVSPDFAADRAVYLYVTTEQDNRVVRHTLDDDDRLTEDAVVLDGIPRGERHDGGRIVFGPDGMLYVATGDVGQAELAQDLDSLAGKILRITPAGRPAPGNPDPDSPVWSSGHRNVQGLAFDDDDRLWASEFGDATFDELNLIEPGGDYGWPQFEGSGGADAGFVDPQVTWAPEDASPSGLAWAEGTLWMAALRGETLWRISTRDDRAGAEEPFLDGEHGRLRSVVAAPDGGLWLVTNNTDGRIEPREGDDRILRIALD